MTPHYADDHLAVYVGDCRDVLATLPPESVHTVVTSPPYWGLRDYGVGGQLGLEPTPEEYVANMVAVFREVRRVLRSDGTVWLNIGDSYAGSTALTTNEKALAGKQGTHAGTHGSIRPAIVPSGLKPKDLVGIPWRLAFALQADGWYLRSDIIWSKPNPMPESVTDRPTKAHEYVFLLSKAPRYYYDADAVREAITASTAERDRYTRVTVGKYEQVGSGNATSDGVGRYTAGLVSHDQQRDPAGRNLRTVWTIATQPYPGAHFATFPEKLVEPCIKAGTSERGVCPECGAPWLREVEVEPMVFRHSAREAAKHEAGLVTALHGTLVKPAERTTTGWRPSCAHDAEPVAATVLDPFGGSGTTARVANRLGRRAILIDLSADYIDQAMARNAQKPLGLVG